MDQQQLQRPTAYEFKSPQAFLVAAFDFKQKQNPRLSLRVFAQKMGFKSPASLSLILSKKRPLNHEHLRKMKTAFDLTENEFHYLWLTSDLPEGLDTRIVDGVQTLFKSYETPKTYSTPSA